MFNLLARALGSEQAQKTSSQPPASHAEASAAQDAASPPNTQKPVGVERRPAHELVKQLAMVLDTESPAASFPFLSMHFVAWQMIHQLYKALHWDLVELYGSDYITSKQDFPVVINLTLMNYTGMHGLPGEGALFHKAVAPVNKLLAAGLGKVVTKFWEERLEPWGYSVVQPRGDNGFFRTSFSRFLHKYDMILDKQ